MVPMDVYDAAGLLRQNIGEQNLRASQSGFEPYDPHFVLVLLGRTVY